MIRILRAHPVLTGCVLSLLCLAGGAVVWDRVSAHTVWLYIQ